MRPAEPRDKVALLGMFDEAVAWLVARDQVGQWGDRPWSQAEEGCRAVQAMLEGGGMYVLEKRGRVVGALDVGGRPEYAQPIDASELYIRLVLTSRTEAGRSFGRTLIERAVELAQGQGAEMMRVDCWAGAPGLVAWYEGFGFACSQAFTLDGWHGQVLERSLSFAS